MMRLRRALGPLAAVWLVWQGGTLVFATAAFGFDAVAVTLIECTCSHGDHAICPMHHKPAPGSKLCLMGSAEDAGAAVLTSLFGGVGLVPAPPSTARPDSQRAVVLGDARTHSLRPAPPDPPPPRA